ncbi:MAG TPA: sodium:proton antiporter [Desulfuromonadales bacterium]|nr:sodium:proton antiporter [Desulfuromonadales bacterium]
MLRHVNMLREFSVPLICGVLLALFWANLNPAEYLRAVNAPFVGSFSLHFISNDLFMVFFFGIAAVEITQSFLPGGSLSPVSRAINPLMATLGGVIGPVIVYLVLNVLFGSPVLNRGWGIPTATDIALAWLVARLIFGASHPAVSYLLLLAVADDAIGLGIIAVFYPDPSHPVSPVWLCLTILGMLTAYGLRRVSVMSYWPYLFLGGVLSWTGLFMAHLHPALALVFILPFLPGQPRAAKGLFEENPDDRSPLSNFEHEWKIIVDFGLFMFGMTNAGVEFSSLGTATWLVVSALIAGKSIGVFGMGYAASLFGMQLPHGMRRRDLLVVGLIAGIGFTVALFIAGEAFIEGSIRSAAKMGAILSILAALIAVFVAGSMGVKKVRE